MSDSFAAMKNQTMIVVCGIVNDFSEFVSQKTGVVYHSVDMLVKGHKNLINIQLPADFNREKLKEGELGKVLVEMSVYNGRTSLRAIK